MVDFNAQGWLQSLAVVDHDAAILEQQYTESSLRLLSLFSAQKESENLTIREIVAQSKQSTQLLKYLEHFPDLLNALDDPDSKHTIWAPTNAAFSTVDLESLPKAELEQTLRNMIAPHDMPIEHIVNMPNVPVLLSPVGLNGSQRIRLRASPKGLQVNYNANITEGNIIAKNGVLHCIDAVPLPPPSMSNIVSLLPPSFSMFESALQKTGLGSVIEAVHNGGTLFIPDNSAFDRLGEEIVTFLFSDEGASYLRRLIEYHFLPSQTLLSNASYGPGDKAPAEPQLSQVPPSGGGSDPRYRLIKGSKSFQLPTQLEGWNLGVTISRHGGIIAMRINGSVPVTVQDGLANNGVVHIVGEVMVLPRGHELAGSEVEDGLVMDLQDLISRFD